MRKTFKHVYDHKTLYVGILIYLLFFVSVLFTGWLDIFFSGAALHVGAKGIDYFQVPRGAWAFLHGGSLTGSALPDGSMYARSFFANSNVYHPFFTLTLGSFLIKFDPVISPFVWLTIKSALTLVVVLYFYWNFRSYRYVQFATILILANFSVYLELAAWQFHFVLNLFLFLLLIALSKKQSTIWAGVCYGLTLLVKPIGLLFIVALLVKRHWKIVALGAGVFLICTIPFFVNGSAQYYIDNLKANIFDAGKLGPNQIISLTALLQFSAITNWPDIVYKAIQYLSLLTVLFLGSLRRTHIAKAILLMVIYFLFFYDQVYEYHWSTLPFVLAICVVLLPEFQTRFSRFCQLLICLPSCFALLNLWHIDIINDPRLGLLPGDNAWKWIVFSKVLPVILLCISISYADIKPTFIQLQTFWHAMLKINDHLQLFGAEAKEQKEIPLSPDLSRTVLTSLKENASQEQ